MGGFTSGLSDVIGSVGTGAAINAGRVSDDVAEAASEFRGAAQGGAKDMADQTANALTSGSASKAPSIVTISGLKLGGVWAFVPFLLTMLHGIHI